MMAALVCVALASLLIGLNGAALNWPALIMCALGLWFVSGGGERWLARRARRRVAAVNTEADR